MSIFQKLIFSTLILTTLNAFGAQSTTATAQTDSKATAKLWDQLNDKKLQLKSKSVLIVDEFNQPIYEKSSDDVLPIASITKLMSAMVVIDAQLPLNEKITIIKEDRDLIQLTGSRLKYGASLTRAEMIKLALMSSENRAATALGRTYPGGLVSFIKAMNEKALSLGMKNSHFADPAGLNTDNTSSARDLAILVQAALLYPLIHEATTQKEITVYPYKRKGPLRYVNTNRLMRNKRWDIALSKTGYINEAGRCLVMQTEIIGQPLTIILLNSFGKLTPFGDANRIRKWIEGGLKKS